MRKPTKKELDFYVGPEITFLGKVEELTSGLCSPVAEGYAGSGKWYNAAAGVVDPSENEAGEGGKEGEVSAYEEADAGEEKDSDKEESE